MSFPLQHLDWLKVLGALSILYISYLGGIILYNVFLHPLRNFPGPLSWRATSLPWALRYFQGTVHMKVDELHKRYGSIVRIAPDQLSFVEGSAWKDIHTPRFGKHSMTMQKDPRATAAIKVPGVPQNILTANTDADHSRIRRVVAPAFSEKAVYEQESFIHQYLALFVDSLKSQCQIGPINAVKWFEYLVFDIIGDLAFGESQNILQKGHSDWLIVVNQIFKSGMRATTLGFFPHLRPLLPHLLRWAPSRKFLKAHAHNTAALMQKRFSTTTDRKDFASYAIVRAEKAGDPHALMTEGEMNGTFQTFMVGGSETTATALSAATFLLSQNPDLHAKLVQEIRSSFSTGDEITMRSVTSQKYLIAVLNEVLRLVPPIASGTPRIVPAGGAQIAGKFVPGGTRVTIPAWAQGRCPANFKHPESMIPERWLGDPEFESDNRDAFQPFSFGPRNCIGKSLALAEMRIIFARFLFEFDFELLDESRSWLANATNHVVWTKPPLMVNLTAVRKS